MQNKRDVYRLRVFENEVLMKISGSKKGETTRGEKITLRHDEFHNCDIHQVLFGDALKETR
jgi:hypothetical protein